MEYSAALKNAGGQWTEDRLQAFLTSPEQFAPGTVMPNPGLSPEAVKALTEALMAKDEAPSVAGD